MLGSGGGDIFGGIASGIAGIASSAIGQTLANNANAALAKDATLANAAEAQKNRDFQKWMSDTAMTRMSYDMKRAGLNPILGIKPGGASTPAGAQANAVTPPAMQSVIPSNAVSSAISMAVALKDLQRQDVSLAKERIELAEKLPTEIKLMQTNAKRAASDEKAARSYAKTAAHQEKIAGSEVAARASEAQLRKATSEIDNKLVWYDAVWKRVSDAIGAAVGVKSGLSSAMANKAAAEWTKKKIGVAGERVPTPGQVMRKRSKGPF